jgi:hypothetical protein
MKRERIKEKTRTESGIRIAFDVIVNFYVKSHKKGSILCIIKVIERFILRFWLFRKIFLIIH